MINQCLVLSPNRDYSSRVQSLLPSSLQDGAWVEIEADAFRAMQLPVEKYNLFLIDSHLGGVDGTQLLVMMKKKAPGARFVLVADVMSEVDNFNGLQAGANLVIGRPQSDQEWEAAMGRIREVLSPEPARRTNVLSDDPDVRSDLRAIFTTECLSGNSALLHVSAEAGTGEIFIFNGELYHAQGGGRGGEAAFLQMLEWQNQGVQVKMHELNHIPPRTIDTPWNQLVHVSQPADDLEAIIRAECATANSVLVQVRASDNEGEIFLGGGVILHAQCPNMKGKPALREIFSWESVRANVVGFAFLPEVTINMEVDAALARTVNPDRPKTGAIPNPVEQVGLEGYQSHLPQAIDLPTEMANVEAPPLRSAPQAQFADDAAPPLPTSADEETKILSQQPYMEPPPAQIPPAASSSTPVPQAPQPSMTPEPQQPSLDRATGSLDSSSFAQPPPPDPQAMSLGVVEGPQPAPQSVRPPTDFQPVDTAALAERLRSAGKSGDSYSSVKPRDFDLEKMPDLQAWWRIDLMGQIAHIEGVRDAKRAAQLTYYLYRKLGEASVALEVDYFDRLTLYGPHFIQELVADNLSIDHGVFDAHQVEANQRELFVDRY